MAKKTKTDKNTKYTHRAVTDLKAGHDPVPQASSLSDVFAVCETCGRQLVEKTED